MASLLTDHNGKKAKNTIVYIGNFKLPGGSNHRKILRRLNFPWHRQQ